MLRTCNLTTHCASNKYTVLIVNEEKSRCMKDFMVAVNQGKHEICIQHIFISHFKVQNYLRVVHNNENKNGELLHIKHKIIVHNFFPIYRIKSLSCIRAPTFVKFPYACRNLVQASLVG